jgi:16S rRNA G966 N2-methylase RsmD
VIAEAHQSARAVAAQAANRDAGVIVNQNQAQSFAQQQDIQTTVNTAPGRSVVYVDPEYQRNEIARMSAQQRAETLRQNQAQMSPEAWARYEQQMTSNVAPQPEQKPPMRDYVK